MRPSCDCREPHPHKRIVLTGGPGAGKTAVLELVRQHFCEHVHVLRESAGIVFGGGFPRAKSGAAVKAAQRAIFYVQRELETAAEGDDNHAIVLCDRGTVDGVAYWPGPDDFWSSVGTSLPEQLLRYDAVIHLRTPTVGSGYDNANPIRVETAFEAASVDARLLVAWADHPRRFIVNSSPDFLAKAKRALDIIRGEMPECCRHHAVTEVDQ